MEKKQQCLASRVDILYKLFRGGCKMIRCETGVFRLLFANKHTCLRVNHRKDGQMNTGIRLRETVTEFTFTPYSQT